MTAKELLTLLFIGFLLYLFARHRNVGINFSAGASDYPAGTDAVDGESLMLTLGYVHGVDAQPSECVIPQPLEVGAACSAPLAADYLDRAYPHVAAISQWNIDRSTSCDASEFSIEIDCNESTKAIGVRGKPASMKLLPNIGGISCHPDIPMDIPNTETV